MFRRRRRCFRLFYRPNRPVYNVETMASTGRHPKPSSDAVSIDEVESVDPAELRDKLLRLFRTPGYVPPVLPKVAIDLLALSRRSDVEIGEIVRLLEQDALIAASVLHHAQSAIHSRGVPVRSLHEAIVRLGLKSIRDIFFGVTVSSKVFRAPGYDEPMNQLRRHSTATAHVARLVCRHTSIYDEYAFLCGLLHDAGMAASLIALAASRTRDSAVPPFASVWPSIEAAHEEGGATLCTLWRLPTDIGYVVETHHAPRRDQPVHPLAAAIAVAEGIVTDLGFGMTGEGHGYGWAANALDLSSRVHASIISEAKALLDAIE